jgi:ABC-type dipeptide/oligopeptide/nickel transport system permease subunit
MSLRQHIATSWQARVGVLLVGGILLLAIVGPYLPIQSPDDIAGSPFANPSGDFLLGTDYLGRDVLSRVMAGGRTVIGFALLATAVGYAVGLPLGLIAGSRRSMGGAAIMRGTDLLLAFPPVLFVLVLGEGLGVGVTPMVIGVAIIQIPWITRVVRAAAAEISVRGYVEAAVARGQRYPSILRREILPNILGVVAADAGTRLTASILIIAALDFLGVGIQPPASDWGLMINENRSGLTVAPWSILVPALLIALLTIGVNLLADVITRGIGRSNELVASQEQP